jgi:hypothetical protein
MVGTGLKDVLEGSVGSMISASSRQLTRLVRQRKELEGAVEKARAEASSQPQEQLRQLRTLLATLDNCPPEELPELRQRVSPLVQCLVKAVHIWVQRRGRRTRYQKRAWVFVEFVGGHWRKIFCSPDGVDVSMAYANEAEANFTVPEGEGEGWA